MKFVDRIRRSDSKKRLFLSIAGGLIFIIIAVLFSLVFSHGNHTAEDHAGHGSTSEHEANPSEHEMTASPHQEAHDANQSKDSDFAADGEAVYTCPMHPQIRSHEQGRCPICGMELVLTQSDSPAHASTEDEALSISPASRRLAGIETVKVQHKAHKKKIRALGSVEMDESRVSTIAAYVDGRIEKVLADYTGIKVKKGEHLAIFYSPQLFAAQEEYLQARQAIKKMRASTLTKILSTQKELLAGSRKKLEEYGMASWQIKQLEKSGKAQSRLEIYAPTGGTVIEKKAEQGKYIKAGQTLYKIATLDLIWVVLELFPEEASYIRYGQKASVSLRSMPNRTFKGRVSFVDPLVNKQTRTVQVRVEIPNPKGELRPGDYAEAEISVPINSKRADYVYDKDLAGKWISPMHPQIIKDKPGKCPICGMDLVPAEKFGFSSKVSEGELIIAIPRDAVLKVGKKSVVFVESEPGKFKLRQVTLGPVTGNEIVILDGLKEGQSVAASGVFLLDSQMQLSGKTSLIDVEKNESGEEAIKAKSEHQHNQ